MNKNEKFPSVLTVVYTLTEDTSALFVIPQGLPPIKLSGHSTDIIRGDGYRWYYALSLSYLATFGWSPIIRDLLGLKRRSNKQLEKGEDGARAQMLEEYISLFAFNETNSFTKPTTNKLLKEIKNAVRLLEVSKVKQEDWRKAFKIGGELFQYLNEYNGAIIQINLNENIMNWKKLPASFMHSDNIKNKKTYPPRILTRGSGTYELYIIETKPFVVEIFAQLDNGGLVNLASKAEEWSLNTNDNFRWHDLFHLSILAIIGWSAICKTMLGLGDDVICRSGIMGMRGALLEEMIISRYFTEISSGVTPQEAAKVVGLLANILTRRTILEDVEPEIWEKSLKKAHELMNEAIITGGGKIRINLDNSEIEFIN